jgi:hypothetical protein
MLVLRSIHRSDQWGQEMSLFLSGAKVCPLNAKVCDEFYFFALLCLFMDVHVCFLCEILFLEYFARC